MTSRCSTTSGCRLHPAAVVSGCAPRGLNRTARRVCQARTRGGCVTRTAKVLSWPATKGIRRTKGTAPACKAPLLVGQLKAALRDTREDLLGIRDRAVLLVGFSGAFRRSELVSLDVADIQFTDDGLVVSLRRSKTDQEGEGRKVGIPHASKPQTCPVRALKAWMEAAGISEGALFRSVNRHEKVAANRLSGRAVA